MFAAILLESPDVIGANQAIVPPEFRQRMRPAIAFQIAGAGAQIHGARRDTGGDQAGVVETAEADGQIETFLNHVQRAVGQFDLKFEQRMPSHELIDQRHDETLAIRHCGCHAQQAAGRTLQIADRQESLIALFNQALATGKKSAPPR